VITVNNPRLGWHSIAVAGTVTADQEQADYPLVNLLNPITYLQWRAVDASEQSITISLPDAQAVDYIGVYGHNWGSQATTVHVEYSTDAGDTWTAAMAPTIPDELDRVLFRTFTEVTADLFRVRLVPSSEVPPEASILYFGRVLVIPRRIYVGHTPLSMGRDAQVSTGLSQSGQFLGRVLESIGYDTSVAFQHLSPTWVRDELDPFIRACITRPFFWSWRPGTYDTEAGLAWFSGALPRAQNQSPNGLMSVSWNMQGVIYPPHFRAIEPDETS
jgi:hypothetical protein